MVFEIELEAQPLETTTEGENLQNYSLARKRGIREIRPSSRYANADLVHFASNVEVELAD